MAISRIEDTELVGKTISELSDRPTDPKTAGGDGLTASKLKERYDALPKLVKDRLNKLIDALTGANDEDLLAQSLKVSEDQTLANFITTITAAVATKYNLPATGIPATDLADAVQTLLGKANTALQEHQDISGKVDVSDFEALVALVSGKTEAESVASYSALVTKLSAMSKTDYNVGQTIYVETADVPDVWVKAKGDSSASYTYTTDAAFITALKAGTLQIGYFVLAPMETEKVDITGKVDKVTTGSKKRFYGVSASNTEEMTEATSSPTASTAMVRDENGRSEVEAGTGDKNAVNYGQMMSKLSGYAKQNGYYATLRSGFADAIHTDREIEDADQACPPVVFGSVGGAAEVQDGLMKFTEMRGHTIKWNQLINKADFPATQTMNGITFTNNGDGTITVSGTASDTAYIKVSGNYQKIAGHKYLIKGCPTGGNGLSGFTLWDNQENKFDNGSGVIYTASTSNGSVYIRVASGTVISTPIVFTPQYFDITDTDYSLVLDFVRDFPMPYYAYNAGTLLSSKSASLISVGRNQWDEEWEVGGIDGSTGENDNSVSSLIRSKNYTMVLPGETYYASIAGKNARIFYYDGNKAFLSYYDRTGDGTFTVPNGAVYIRFRMNTAYGTTYNHDICIYINWETPGLPYVPYSKQTITLPNLELRSAGSAYDVAYQQGGGKRRIGTVDLGTLEWTYNSEKGAFYATISDAPNYTNNVLCAKYQTVHMQVIWSGSQDDVCSMQNNYIGASYNKRIVIRDTSYTDATTFMAAMDGVMLYYELAEETDITTTENPGWDEFVEIDNFGTIEFTQDPAQTVLVPQAYFVCYTVNLVEFLDSLYVRCGGDVSKLALVEDD